MRNLHLKSEASGVDVLFQVYDYGDTKSHDWRITFRTKVSGQLFGKSGSISSFDRGNYIPNKFEVGVEDSVYGLSEKDLDRLAKWVGSAREEIARLKERKKRF